MFYTHRADYKVQVRNYTQSVNHGKIPVLILKISLMHSQSLHILAILQRATHHAPPSPASLGCLGLLLWGSCLVLAVHCADNVTIFRPSWSVTLVMLW
jgi:hypothetical protein